MAREFPVVFHFKVEFGISSDEEDHRFQEVSGLSAEVSAEELREGGLNTQVHRLPTGTKHVNLVLKRGYLDGTKVTAWCKDAVENFKFEPTDVLVSLLNEQHQPLVKWTFAKAWPVKWSVSDMKAQENALSIESLELAHRGLRKV